MAARAGPHMEVIIDTEVINDTHTEIIMAADANSQGRSAPLS